MDATPGDAHTAELAPMPEGLRSSLGLITLISGLVTTGIGVITFLGNHSWDDFLFRAGIFALIALAVALLVLVAQDTQPPRQSPEASVKPVGAGAGLEGVIVVALVMIAWYSCLGVLLLVLGVIGVSEFGPADFVRWVGAAAVMFVPVSVVVGWSDVATAITRTGSSRPCPRCGHGVPSGQMKCESCGFDFWTIGRER